MFNSIFWLGCKDGLAASPAERVQMHKKTAKSLNSSVRSKPKSKTNEGKGFAQFTPVKTTCNL